MVFGIIGRALIARTKKRVSQWLDSEILQQNRCFETEELFCCLINKFLNPEKEENSFWSVLNNSQGLILDGQIYNDKEFSTSDDGYIPIARSIWEFYQKQGLDSLKRLNGDFSMVFGIKQVIKVHWSRIRLEFLKSIMDFIRTGLFLAQSSSQLPEFWVKKSNQQVQSFKIFDFLL